MKVAVAVKTLKVGSSIEEKVDFLSEAEMMKRFDHKVREKEIHFAVQPRTTEGVQNIHEPRKLTPGAS